jgi:hypothetical protein
MSSICDTPSAPAPEQRQRPSARDAMLQALALMHDMDGSDGDGGVRRDTDASIDARVCVNS